MSLVQVATNTVTSPVASVTLTGIDSDDVYMVAINNMTPVNDNVKLNINFTVSGTADTSANYDEANKALISTTTFPNRIATNDTKIQLETAGTGTSESNNLIMYLFNFNNASEYSFCTIEETTFNATPLLIGNQGGGVLTVAQACDGIQYSYATGNVNSGTFTLYKVI
jgi:hypothetical protein